MRAGVPPQFTADRLTARHQADARSPAAKDPARATSRFPAAPTAPGTDRIAPARSAGAAEDHRARRATDTGPPANPNPLAGPRPCPCRPGSTAGTRPRLPVAAYTHLCPSSSRVLRRDMEPACREGQISAAVDNGSGAALPEAEVGTSSAPSTSPTRTRTRAAGCRLSAGSSNRSRASARAVSD